LNESHAAGFDDVGVMRFIQSAKEASQASHLQIAGQAVEKTGHIRAP